MITIIRLTLNEPVVTHVAGRFGDVLADFSATALSGQVLFVVDGSRVLQLKRTPNDRCLIGEATGYQIIGIHDALRGDDGLSLYKYTTRSIALDRMLAVLGEKYPAPIEVEELPMIKL